MPRGFSEHEKESIRKRLVREGYKQFSAYGLKKTSVEDLAKAGHISKGAFYLFYESKEALFMDIVEEVEQRARQEITAAIQLPGPSSRARLVSVFKRGLALLKSIPMLQFFTGSEYDLLLRRVPAKKIRAHLESDRLFLEDLVIRCRNAGIAIRVRPEEISGLLYPLVLASMHADDLSQNNFGVSIDVLLELVAAFCLGEVTITPQEPKGATAGADNGSRT